MNKKKLGRKILSGKITKWKTIDMSECIEKIIDYRGKTPKKLGGNWSNSGIRALSAKNIKKGKVVGQNDIRYVNYELYKKWMKDEIKRGDILLTSEGPLGEYMLWDSDEKIVLSQRLFGIRANKNIILAEYLYVYISTVFFQSELLSRASGTTVQGIKQTELLKTKIIVPAIDYQNKIAKIILDLDDQIELNNKMNRTLEQIAQSIFKHWFIDFKFPNDKGKPYQSSGGKMINSERSFSA